MTMNSVVIGSGFGGIASALRLKAKGHKVTLIEKHPDLGGRARVFKKNGFTYDGGPTVITAPYLINELFELFEKNPKDWNSQNLNLFCPKSKDCETHGQTDCCHRVIEYMTACKCPKSRKGNPNLRATFRPLLKPFLFAQSSGGPNFCAFRVVENKHHSFASGFWLAINFMLQFSLQDLTVFARRH